MKRPFLWDTLLIAFLLLISVGACLFLFFGGKSGGAVSVEIDGENAGIYSLAHDGEFSVGDGSNILEIRNGKAYMKSADCPDKTCVHTRPISKVGESIVCLPNRVTVSVIGEGDVDLVS